jgi:hypothetical protein
MSQLTVRDVDETLGEALKKEAALRGVSVNRLVLQLLREGVGLASPRGPVRYTDLDHFIGKWTAEEADEFDRHLAEQRKIDPDLWN